MGTYIVIYVVISALVFFDTNSGALLFWILVFITLPWGLFAAQLTYFASLASPEFIDSVIGRVALYSVWLIGVLAQVWLFNLVARLRSRGEPRQRTLPR